VVTLMTYPDRPVSGRVLSIGWGIYQDDGASGPDLLPKFAPKLLNLKFLNFVTPPAPSRC